MELDHVFVMCDVGAPEADVLIARGLREGSPNTHQGQGTACRRFFFENAYLELVWVADRAEAQSAGVAPTRLWERWSERRSGASPFGIVLRGGSDPDAMHPTWPTWSYRPSWLPEDQTIAFADGQSLHEPAIIALPFIAGRSRTGVEPLDHDVPLTQLVGASFGCVGGGAREAPAGRARAAGPPGQVLSDAAQTLAQAGIATFTSSDEPMVRLRFAGDRLSTLDLRPALPLVVEW